MIENLIPQLVTLLVPWREIWYEVKTKEEKRYHRTVPTELHCVVVWNEEQKVAKLSIVEVDSDNVITPYHESVAICGWYMDAIRWSQTEIEKQYQEYLNGV